METHDTIVIGGGQAGLAVGYYLQKYGCEFVILDEHARTGDSWRQRWDSLHLFTPARYDGLDGMHFPGPGDAFPSKDQMADYMESYAQRFELPIRHEMRVERLSRNGERFEIATPGLTFQADNVVVAMANYQSPRIPDFANSLSSEIASLHSSEYCNPSQLRDGAVLVVGVGNSGVEIAFEVAKTHRTILAGNEGVVVPWRIESYLFRMVLARLVRFAVHHVLTVRTPLGRRMRARGEHTAPVVRVKPADLTKVGVERVARISDVRGGLPVTETGKTLDVANVIWCTGYRPGFAWIDLPVFGEQQIPTHMMGAVPDQPGLYFVGLPFIYSLSSALVTGVSRDARRIARQVEMRHPNETQTKAAARDYAA